MINPYWSESEILESFKSLLPAERRPNFEKSYREYRSQHRVTKYAFVRDLERYWTENQRFPWEDHLRT